MITIKLGKDNRPSSVQAAERILEYITDEITDKTSGNVAPSEVESKLWQLLADLADKQANGTTESQPA